MQNRQAQRRRSELLTAFVASITLISTVTVLIVMLFTLPGFAQTPAPAQTPAKAPAEVPAPAPTPGPAGGTQPDPSAATSPEVDPDMKRVAACKAQALAKLKQRSPAIDDIYIDIDGLTIATAEARLGETDVKGVIMGEAYIQRDRSDSANRFLCLTGPKDEVLFTFFTER
ncbi:hypothetical protein [Ancylobacter sp. G4_0304]|uniref:hypothetical protein n=1 Tax=Ancylobacter sp. G4_0304 TaxID=3114289 RepID=UPI0039C66831